MQNIRIYLTAFFFIFTTLSILGQTVEIHPFSRDDSAKVIQYQAKVNDQLAINDKKTASDWLNRIAMVYWEHNDFRVACEFYERSLVINEALGNENGTTMIKSNLGLLYSDLQEYEKSAMYFKETLAARRSKKEPVGIISALINLSVVHNNIEQYKESIVYLDEALEMARERNDERQMMNCYGNLSETHEKAGNTEEAIRYFNLYSVFFNMIQKKEIGEVKEELESERLRGQLTELAKRNKELELVAKRKELVEKETIIVRADSTNKRLTKSLTKREMELRMVNQESRIDHLESERKLQDEKAKFIYLEVGGVFLVLIVIGMFYANRQIQKAHNKLESKNKLILHQKYKITESNTELERINDEVGLKNKEITASINYASLIQSASLFKSFKLADYFDESFILFKPKDIVSGDFYWYERVGDEVLMAAVDCTGHGVPGGFMSMIASNQLREIVLGRGILSPSKILDQLDTGVKQALNQRENGNKDGMDIALCSINIKNKTLRFAGAKNPLLLVRNGELQYIKGSKRPIGGNFRHQLPPFEEIKISLEGETMIYMYSDGFQDQFGGDRNKKFSNQRFRQLLLSAHTKTAEEQHSMLFDELLEWKSSYKQVDDILVMGVRVKC